jgi:small subunit ribosomal protein S6
MRNYEAMYILKTDADAEKMAANVEKYRKLIVDNGGEIVKLDEWGKRKLAYEVMKQREGYYVLMNFKSEAPAVHELDRVLKISDDIIRFLIVKLDEKKPAPVKAVVAEEAPAVAEAVAAETVETTETVEVATAE